MISEMTEHKVKLPNDSTKQPIKKPAEIQLGQSHKLEQNNNTYKLHDFPLHCSQNAGLESSIIITQEYSILSQLTQCVIVLTAAV